MDHTTEKRISSEAAKKATGRTWAEWFTFLDHENAQAKGHKEIVRLLHDKGCLKSGWWAQTVAVEYERARGNRVVGETAAAGFEIGVQRTISILPDKAWELITGPKGVDAWLGKTSDFQFARGRTYTTEDGTSGEVRSIEPGRRLRITWKAAHWLKTSTVQVSIVPSGGKSSIRFHQEKLSAKMNAKRCAGTGSRYLTVYRILRKPELLGAGRWTEERSRRWPPWKQL